MVWIFDPRPCAAHFKPPSVVLAECGHFVVTWSVTVQFNVPQNCYEFKLMKLLFGFCLNFLLPKFWITQASNLEITKKIMATLELR